MPEDFIRPEGIVDDRVENGFIVVGPDGVSGGHRDFLGIGFPGLEVLEAELVLTPGERVHAVRQDLVVGADGRPADLEIARSGGHFIAVQEDLLPALKRLGLAAEKRVIPARLETGVVPVAVFKIRDGHVRRLDPPVHLGDQLLLERLGRLQDRLGVGVLGLEVLHDLGIGPLVQPVVLVHPGLAVDRELLADFLRGRRTRDLLGLKKSRGQERRQDDSGGRPPRGKTRRFHESLL